MSFVSGFARFDQRSEMRSTCDRHGSVRFALLVEVVHDVEGALDTTTVALFQRVDEPGE